MLNKSGRSGHSCLVPDLREMLSAFTIHYNVGFSFVLYVAFITLRYVPSVTTLLNVFILNKCWILSKAFSASIKMIIWLLAFNLLKWCITLIDLQILNHSCIPGINPTWSWCAILLIHCWIQFANILLRIFASMFIRNIGLYFSFLWCFWFLYQSDADLVSWVQKHFLPFNFFLIIWKR